MSSNTQQTTLITGAAILAIVAGIAVYLLTQKASEPAGYPKLGGDFTLESASGPVSLNDFKGKVVSLFFGYTNCPDICPATLSTIGQAYRDLEADELKQVQGIFVSVDPDRDTPETLAQYTRFFHPQITGLTGKEVQIQDIARRYGVFYARATMDDSAAEYGVDHSGTLFMIGKNGVVRQLLNSNASAADVSASIRQLL